MENNGYIKDLLTSFIATSESTIAFSVYDGKQVANVSFMQFANDILCAAGYFVQNNIHSKHIALVAPNSYQWLVTFFAITGSGNIAVLLNRDLPEDIIAGQCKQADVEMI